METGETLAWRASHLEADGSRMSMPAPDSIEKNGASHCVIRLDLLFFSENQVDRLIN
jgi:hypothetical protein